MIADSAWEGATLEIRVGNPVVSVWTRNFENRTFTALREAVYDGGLEVEYFWALENDPEELIESGPGV